MAYTTTCRYCPFYAPEPTTPLKGRCGFTVPARFVELPYNECPARNDRAFIDALAWRKGFTEHVLKRVVLQTYYTDGLPTHYYNDIEALMAEHPNAPKVYALYIDQDRRVFYRVRVPHDGEGAIGDI